MALYGQSMMATMVKQINWIFAELYKKKIESTR